MDMVLCQLAFLDFCCKCVPVIEFISFLKMSRLLKFFCYVPLDLFENRFISPVVEQCYNSIDESDVPIKEPEPFDPSHFSHKFMQTGLRYEVDLNISNVSIVWVNGPYPCGAYPDICL